MTLPTIHNNGTSRESLLDQVCNAGAAARALLKALSDMAPNGRDYYLQTTEVLIRAVKEHDARVSIVKRLLTELEELAEGIADA